jgi:hypothetical protein
VCLLELIEMLRSAGFPGGSEVGLRDIQWIPEVVADNARNPVIRERLVVCWIGNNDQRPGVGLLIVSPGHESVSAVATGWFLPMMGGNDGVDSFAGAKRAPEIVDAPSGRGQAVLVPPFG